MTILGLESAWANTNQPILKANLSTKEGWQRQQILVSIEVHTSDAFARLKIDEFTQSGLSIVELDQTQTGDEKEGYILAKRWAVFPLQTGNITLQLPRIRYRPNRGGIKTLVSPTLALSVKALPIYVSPTMPVGKIRLQSEWHNGLLVTTKNLLEWEIKVIGKGVMEQTMPPISRQLKQSQPLQIYPVQSERKMIQTKLGLSHLFTYQVPLKARQTGRLILPNISVQYFDPKMGKLQRAELNPPFVVSLNKVLQWIIGILLVALFSTVLLIVSRWLKASVSRFVEKRKALQVLEQATSYKEARNALNRLADAHRLGENLTLHAFTVEWQHRYGSSIALEKAMELLNSGEFEARSNESQSKETVSQLVKTISVALLR